MYILLTITIISILIALYCILNKVKIDTESKEINQRIRNDLDLLKEQYETEAKKFNEIENMISDLNQSKNFLEENIKTEKEHLNTIQENIKSTLDSQTELSKNAFNNYCKVLENAYETKEKEYNELIEQLNNSYGEIQMKLIAEAEDTKLDLEKIKSSRTALIEAARREKEIQEKSSFYCLQLPESDTADMIRLENIAPSLNNPRVLRMLIWQSFVQKPLKSLSTDVLGNYVVTGIYKITNQKTGECYIGQAVDVRTRWAEHAKAGLGIDTPANNKLYKAMKEYGITSFSWELLEQCPQSDLNEKEHFYIDLYDSYNSGYNSNRGIDKK